MSKWDSVRQQFPVTKKYTYLNHAAVAPLSLPCIQGFEDYSNELMNHGAAHYPAFISELMTKVRAAGASMLGTQPQNIFMVRSTTQGLSIVATGLPYQSGDNVVLVDKEFPANTRPWLPLQKKGVELRFVPQPQGRVDLQRLAELVDDKTAVVSVSFVQFLSGYRVDLARVAEICHSRNALFVVDGIQGVGAMPIHVEEMGVDFLSADSHKWLLGPEGVGLGYASPRALERIEQAVEGWLGLREPFDLFNRQQPLKRSAARYEEGALNIAGVHAMLKSLQMLLELGIDDVSQRILELTDHICESLLGEGWEILSPREAGEKSGIVLARKEGIDFDQLDDQLLARNIVASVRGGALRVAPHCYNNGEDIGVLLKALKDIGG